MKRREEKKMRSVEVEEMRSVEDEEVRRPRSPGPAGRERAEICSQASRNSLLPLSTAGLPSPRRRVVKPQAALLLRAQSTEARPRSPGPAGRERAEFCSLGLHSQTGPAPSRVSGFSLTGCSNNPGQNRYRAFFLQAYFAEIWI